MNDLGNEYGDGSDALASQLRRAIGLAIDWAACLLIATLLVEGRVALWPHLILGVANLVLVTTLGQTLGMRLARTRIVPVGPGSPWPLRVLVRTALLLLVIPAAIGGAGGRPLHDRIAGTAIVVTERS